jgi:hypothetical protein
MANQPFYRNLLFFSFRLIISHGSGPIQGMLRAGKIGGK